MTVLQPLTKAERTKLSAEMFEAWNTITTLRRDEVSDFANAAVFRDDAGRLMTPDLLGARALAHRYFVALQRWVNRIGLIERGAGVRADLLDVVDGHPRILHESAEFMRELGASDDDVAGFVESFFDNGPNWREWVDDPPVFAFRIGLVVWEYQVAAKRAGNRYPALPEVVVPAFAAILSGHARGKREGNNTRVFDHDEQIGTLRAPDGKSDDMMAALASVHAHRLLRELVTSAWENALDDVAQPEVVVVANAWAGVARRIGTRTRKGAQAVQRAGEALAAVHLRTSRDDEPILAVTTTRTSDGINNIELRLRGPLVPGYIHTLRENKKLVPLPPVLPALTPSTRTQSAQLAYQMLVLRELRLRATDFDADRRVEIAEEVWRRLAARVGLPEATRSAVMKLWCSRGPQRFLIRDANTYKLAPAYALLDEHLVQSAEQTNKGKARRRRGR